MRDTKLNLGSALTYYTAPTSGSYDPVFDAEVRARFPHWFTSSVDINKAELLALPANSPRPSQDTVLGAALPNYMGVNSNVYDAEFTKLIRERQPQWFDSVARNKAALLDLPLGSIRPLAGKHPLGRVLTLYTAPSSKGCDPEFAASIRQRFPHWYEDSAARKKAELLSLPVEGLRPKRGKHPLADSLISYISPSSTVYDAEFSAAIHKRYPHWFEDTAVLKKKEILALPVGALRPDQPTTLGRSLGRFLNCEGVHYDPDFDQQVRERFPHWFEETPERKKAALLALPEGSPRPNMKTHPLGVVVGHYTRSTSALFDGKFAAAIQARFPHWFANTATTKKDEMLAMPLGSPRPDDALLRHALHNYLNPKHRSHDPGFVATIRARFPHWFEDTVARNKEELLAMPLDSPRPQRKKTPLARALSNYTCQGSAGFDKDFDAAIRARFPRWFKG